MAGDANLIGLEKWAERLDPPPSKHTVRQWIKRGLIHPEPKKFGRRYYFEPGAIYQTSEEARSDALIRRVQEGST